MITNFFALSKNPQLADFRDYVHSFYGKEGLYDLGCGIPDIEIAIVDYLNICVNPDRFEEWGDGDSLDRERVRFILEAKGFEEIKKAA